MFAGMGDRLCVKKSGVLKKVGSTSFRCGRVGAENINVMFMRRENAQSLIKFFN
jgi:hypothetical protein